MEHLKIISSAAYLKIHKSQKEVELFAEIVLPNCKEGELFYNKEKGVEVLNQLHKENKIIEEEYIYLNHQIISSSLIEKSYSTADNFFELMIKLADIFNLSSDSKKIDKNKHLALARLANAGVGDGNNIVLLGLIERNINRSYDTDGQTIN